MGRPTWAKTPKPTKEQKTPRPTWEKTPRPTKKMDKPTKWSDDKPRLYQHAEEALYRDPYERRYSMRNSEPKHDNYGDNHWQKTPRPTEWKMDKTPRPTWKKTPKPSEYGHGQWEKDNDYKYKEEM